MILFPRFAHFLGFLCLSGFIIHDFLVFVFFFIFSSANHNLNILLQCSSTIFTSFPFRDSTDYLQSHHYF